MSAGSHEDGSAPLAFAAAKGHLDVVRSLVGHGAPVNAVDKSDASALVKASCLTFQCARAGFGIFVRLFFGLVPTKLFPCFTVLSNGTKKIS